MDDSTRRMTRAGKTDPALPDETEIRAVEIRAEIAETRGEISETIEAIEERLSPSHLAQQAKDTVRNAATEKVKQMANTAGDTMDQLFGNSIMDTVRANPIPAAMIGIGAAWLLKNRRSGVDRGDGRGYRAIEGGGDYGGAYGRRSSARGYAGSGYAGGDYSYGSESGAVGTRGTMSSEGSDTIASQAREAIGDLSSRASDAAADVRDAAWRTSRRAQLQVSDVMQNNPLILGAAAVLIGAVVGMSVPGTDTENQLMGEARDAVVDRAREMATNAAGNVEQIATQVKDQAKDLTK